MGNLVKPVEQMDNDTLMKHLNARHMPMRATTEPGGIALTFIPNMSTSLAAVWRAWHNREHQRQECNHDHTTA